MTSTHLSFWIFHFLHYARYFIFVKGFELHYAICVSVLWFRCANYFVSPATCCFKGECYQLLVTFVYCCQFRYRQLWCFDSFHCYYVRRSWAVHGNTFTLTQCTSCSILLFAIFWYLESDDVTLLILAYVSGIFTTGCDQLPLPSFATDSGVILPHSTLL